MKKASAGGGILDAPQFASLVDDPCLGEDLIDVLRHYEKCLAQDDLDPVDPIIPQEVVDKWAPARGRLCRPSSLARKAEPAQMKAPSSTIDLDPKSSGS